MSALAAAIHFLEDGNDDLAGKLRDFRNDFGEVTMI